MTSVVLVNCYPVANFHDNEDGNPFYHCPRGFVITNDIHRFPGRDNDCFVGVVADSHSVA